MTLDKNAALAALLTGLAAVLAAVAGLWRHIRRHPLDERREERLTHGSILLELKETRAEARRTADDYREQVDALRRDVQAGEDNRRHLWSQLIEAQTALRENSGRFGARIEDLEKIKELMQYEVADQRHTIEIQAEKLDAQEKQIDAQETKINDQTRQIEALTLENAAARREVALLRSALDAHGIECPEAHE